MNIMRIISALSLTCAVAMSMPAAAGAVSPGPSVLHFLYFPDYARAAPPPNKPTPMKHHRRVKEQDIANRSAEIDKLHNMVLQEFGEEQDGFIRLSGTEFLVFVSNTGRVVMGLYLADLATDTWSEEPVAQGEVGVQATLNDKSGNDYMLLHHFYPMHAGVSGESYSLLSVRGSARGRPIVNDMSIGEAEEYDDESDTCARDSKRIVHSAVAVSVEDVNHDGHLDVSVTQSLLNCATGRTSTQVTNYLATHSGFASATALTAGDFSRAGKQALAVYARGTKYAKTNPHGAAQVLEQAGIDQILYQMPAGIPAQAYAGLLNDYAFFIAPSWKAEEALDILDRVIQISPARGVAYLNRAEVDYQMLQLGQFKTQQEKLAAARQIMKDYDTYKALTKKKVEWLEQFSAFNLAYYPKDLNVCDFVRKYYEAGRERDGIARLDEIPIASRRLDINNDGIEEDVDFAPGKVGYKTYSALSFRDPRGKWVKFSGSVSKKSDHGWGFRIFGFRGKIYKLLPMGDVSMIDHDRETLVCVSQWGSIPANGGGRRLLAIWPVQ